MPGHVHTRWFFKPPTWVLHWFTFFISFKHVPRHILHSMFILLAWEVGCVFFKQHDTFKWSMYFFSQLYSIIKMINLPNETCPLQRQWNGPTLDFRLAQLQVLRILYCTKLRLPFCTVEDATYILHSFATRQPEARDRIINVNDAELSLQVERPRASHLQRLPA